jgi:hypothetical protein
MLDNAYVGSGRSWFRRGKKSGSTAIGGMGDGSSNDSRMCAHRSNIVAAWSSGIPMRRCASRSARWLCSEPDLVPVLSVVAGGTGAGSTVAIPRLAS